MKQSSPATRWHSTLILRQLPSPAEALGIALIAAGVALHRPSA